MDPASSSCKRLLYGAERQRQESSIPNWLSLSMQELAQTTHLLGPVAYHDYEGILVDPGEQDRLAADVGDANTVILRNHGVITLGPSVGGALFQMDQLMLACELQVSSTCFYIVRLQFCDRQDCP